MSPTALAVCGDAGAGEAIAPVVARLLAHGRLRPEVLASSVARPAFDKLGLSCGDLAALDAATAGAAFASRRPGVVMTGASWASRSELPFVQQARQRGIPTVAVLDYWSNYRGRFAGSDGALDLPDKIAVMDERAREEMVAEGFPDERLVVTGAPHLEAVYEARPAPEAVAALRASAALAADERLVVFLSQPLRRVGGEDYGFDEREVLGLLVAALDEIAALRGVRPVVGIKPHPLDAAGQYDGISAPRVRVVSLPAADNAAWLLAADLVVGMNSVLLLHACLLGRLALSVQPGLRGRDVVPTNRSGQSLAVYDARELAPLLERALLDEAFRAERAAVLGRQLPPGGAAERVAGLVEAVCMYL